MIAKNDAKENESVAWLNHERDKRKAALTSGEYQEIGWSEGVWGDKGGEKEDKKGREKEQGDVEAWGSGRLVKWSVLHDYAMSRFCI